jgi:hypothetical protein
VSAVADKLDEARALIERGWCRGEYEKRNGVCAYGAVQQVVNGDPSDCAVSPLSRAMLKYVLEAADTHALLAWNDRQKTKKPVIDAFKRAAELARADEQ